MHTQHRTKQRFKLRASPVRGLLHTSTQAKPPSPSSLSQCARHSAHSAVELTAADRGGAACRPRLKLSSFSGGGADSGGGSASLRRRWLLSPPDRSKHGRRTCIPTHNPPGQQPRRSIGRRARVLARSCSPSARLPLVSTARANVEPVEAEPSRLVPYWGAAKRVVSAGVDFGLAPAALGRRASQWHGLRRVM